MGDIAEWPKNPRQLSKHDAEQLRQSIDRFGLADPLIVNADGSMIGGHQRKKVMIALQEFGEDALIDVRVPSRQLTEKEAEELAIRLNRNAGEWDWDVLASGFEVGDLLEYGFQSHELSIIADDIDYDELWKGMPEFESEDLTPESTLIIHFANEKDRQNFAQLIEQNITEKTKSVWYPEKRVENLQQIAYMQQNES